MTKMPTATAPLRIGTRRSPLAQAQARQVAAALSARARVAADAIQIVPISTQGDKRLDIALADIGGKGLFTAELETAMRHGKIDCAVHSLKDLPTRMAEDLQITAVLARADARDVLLSPRHFAPPEDATTNAASFLPKGARVGTASLRRQAQLLRLRPDVRPELLRGNIATRLKKIDASTAQDPLFAILAVCGLERQFLSEEGALLAERPHVIFNETDMLPAAGQGALAVQSLAGDAQVTALLKKLDDAPTRCTTDAERAFLAELDGSCRLPIAARATLDGDAVHLIARLLSKDGRQCGQAESRAPRHNAAQAGYAAGRAIRKRHASLLATLTAEH